VAYLDDDNWWAPTHLSDLLAAMEGRTWAYSLRWFAHPANRRPIAIDVWESVGPGKGVFQPRFGGFVDPNCLMIDKLAAWECVVLWNMPLRSDRSGMSEDRNVFNFLRSQSQPGETGEATSFYVINPKDGLHSMRLEHLGERYDQAGAAPAT
ncbi:MAG: hypothetical protein ACHP7N_18360, partial [Caulobacterales bacterium]